MTLVSRILNRSNTSIHSKSTYVIRNLLRQADATELRARVLTDGTLIEQTDSWASRRKEFVNLQYIMTLDATVRPIVDALYRRDVRFSYNFTSIYVNDCELLRHVDRVGCDVNVIIYLGDDDNNCSRPAIIIGVHEEGRDFLIDGNIGDAVILLGREVEHFRPADPSRTNLISTILHYVFVQ
jgi:hypothetical protein